MLYDATSHNHIALNATQSVKDYSQVGCRSSPIQQEKMNSSEDSLFLEAMVDVNIPWTKGLASMFYLVSPTESSYKTVEEVPQFYRKVSLIRGLADLTFMLFPLFN
ncbi:hypothetical protein J6590_022236 [Homalodisca vitripennis]|nr:hypothetical protein J6590_022236 [Homalodisca vitripennis]